ncbi:unnamed protein product [Closterium sp. NIES-54]
MMEFGEGVNKLRRAIATTGGGGPSGSFAAFEAEAGAVLELEEVTSLPPTTPTPFSHAHPRPSLGRFRGGVHGNGRVSRERATLCWATTGHTDPTTQQRSTRIPHTSLPPPPSFPSPCLTGSEVECVTMDGSAESYSLLGDYGAGQQLYRVHFDPATGQRCLEFCSLLPFHQAVVGDGAGSGSESEGEGRGGARAGVTRASVPLPRLTATEEELKSLAW